MKGVDNMGCDISTCCGIGSSLVGGCKCSAQYGYSNKMITITTAGTFDLWSASGLPSISGTVVIELVDVPFPTFVQINNDIFGIGTISDIFSRSVNPLESVSIITSATTEICVSIIANGFECC